MREQLQEAIDILDGLMGRDGRWPAGLVRARHLLEQVLQNAFLESDDIVALSFAQADELAGELEPPFPAA